MAISPPYKPPDAQARESSLSLPNPEPRGLAAPNISTPARRNTPSPAT